MSKTHNVTGERLRESVECARAMRDQYTHHVFVEVNRDDSAFGVSKDQYQHILDVLYNIARPDKTKSPQQDKWLLFGQTSQVNNKRQKCYMVQFRDKADAALFKLSCANLL